MKKLLTILLLTLAGIILLALILAPGIAKNYFERHSKDYIGRNVSIGNLKLNYFFTTLNINDLKLYEPDGKEIFVSFDKLAVNLQPFNLLKNEIVVEKLHLTGLFVNIIQADSSFNFDDILEFLNTPSDSVAAKSSDTIPSRPWGFRMFDFQLKNAHFVYDDRKVGQATHLRDFSLEVPYIEWNEGESEAGIQFSTARDGHFASTLKIDQENGEYLAHVSIKRLHLDNFKEYIAHYTGIQSIDGIFNCQVGITGNIHDPLEFKISGLLEMSDLVMTDTTGEKLLGAGRIDIGLKNIDYSNSQYEIDSVILTQPYLHFILWDSTNNISTAFKMPEDTSATEEDAMGTTGTTETDTLYYSIHTFHIRNGMIDYTDHLTDQPFHYHLSGIELKADSLTSAAGWIDLYSGMILNERGTLNAEVGFNPADPLRNISLNYVITDFLLTDLNIHSRYFTGIPILMGDMYYKSETTISEGKITSENKLIMTEVALGEKGRGLYDIPIKLALFILKDRNGVITLDIPVRGDLDDPKVKLGRLIWNTFKNLMIKIATAPFDILAGQVGADPKELEFIGFNYADTSLTVEKQRQLELLLQLENQKPGLGIELVYYNDETKEKEFIRSLDQSRDEAEIQALAELYKSARLQNLGNFLKGESDSTNIIISFSDVYHPDNSGSLPVFRIIYSLEENP